MLCVFLSLRKCLQKNIRKTRPKHCKTSAKHRKTLFFVKHSQNTAKHPQNTRKTPQNIAEHHKTDLLTKQTELANKPLRSPAPRAWPRMSSIAATAAPARKLTMEPGHDARARKSMRSVSTYIQRNLISPFSFSARSEQIENRRLWLHWVPDRPITVEMARASGSARWPDRQGCNHDVRSMCGVRTGLVHKPGRSRPAPGPSLSLGRRGRQANCE